MDNNKKYFDSPEFGRLLQRYERSLQIGKDEYFESDELSDIAEYYYDKKTNRGLNTFSTTLCICTPVQCCHLFSRHV